MNSEFPFIGGAYTARSKDLNAQECQNLYVEVDKTGAKNPISLVGSPGCKNWTQPGGGAEVRGMIVYNDYLYSIIGSTVWKIGKNKNSTNIGTIGTNSGWVDLVIDITYLVIYDSTGGWYTTGVNLTKISDVDFPTPSGATYQDGYHIVSKQDTDEIYIPSQDDVTTWDATEYATAEGNSDKLVKPISIQRQLWLVGERSTEIWYNSGATFPFQRNPGGFINIGCGARRSISTFNNSLIFLDNYGRIVKNQGFDLAPISTYQIEYLISTLSNIEDAVAFIYHQEGHTFYEISFSNKTLCYDLTTDMWSTRASGQFDGRNRANCVVEFDNKILVGDYENGKIYEYDLATYTDNGDTKRAIRACQFVSINNQNVFINALEIDMETGHSDGNISLGISRDSGRTWISERIKDIGGVGEYNKRVKFPRLGKARNFTARITISDDIPRNIQKAYLDLTVGNV